MDNFDANESTLPICPDCYVTLDSDEHECTGPIQKRDSNIGRCINGRYEIVESLGIGGMGHVYAAKDVLLGREVALKLMHKYLVSRPTTVQRFQQEAKAASAIHAPNVVSIFDFGLTEEGEPFMVMERLTGKSVSQFLDGRPLPWKQAVEIALGACEGLKAAHANKVIHRDIKPSNIIVCANEHGEEVVKVVDFGIAKLLSDDGDDAVKLTKTGDVFGSPLYMSPEQCAGKKVDIRSDIYSLGCVLYEAIAGYPPIQGSSSLEVIHNHLNKQPEELRKICTDLPDVLNRTVARSLSKEPEYRYQSIAEFEADLKRALQAGQLVPHEASMLSPELKLAAAKTPFTVIASSLLLIIIMGSVAHLTNMNVFVLVSIGVISFFGLTAGFVLLFGTWANGLNKWDYIPLHLKGKHKQLIRALADCHSDSGLALGVIERPPIESLLLPWQEKTIGLTAELRKTNAHVLVVGLAATGKSHFLATLIASDLAKQNRSVFVVDADGDLTDIVRTKFSGRGCFIDPVLGTTSGFNPFETSPEEDLSASAGFLVKALCVDKSITETTEAVLRDAIWLLMAIHHTFDDLPGLLSDKRIRDSLCKKLESKAQGTQLDLTRLRNKWEQHSRDALSPDWFKTIDPCLELCATLFSDERIRALLTPASASVNILECHHRRSLVVLRLAERTVSPSAIMANSIFTARLIGALRANSSGHEQPSSLYIDGADRVLNPRLLDELTATACLATSVTLTTLKGLPEEWATFAKTRFGTICAFNLSREDASDLAPVMFPLHGQRVYASSSPWADQRIKIVTDEMELNKQRLATLEPRSFYAYFTGTAAGLFRLRSQDFSPDSHSS